MALAGVGVVESMVLLVDLTAEHIMCLVCDQHMTMPVTGPNVGTCVECMFVDFFLPYHLFTLLIPCSSLIPSNSASFY